MVRHNIQVFLVIATLANQIFGTTVTLLEPCTVENDEKCDVLRFYNQYQTVKCIKRETVRIIGKGDYECRNDASRNPSKMCYYPECQLRLTDNGFEPDVRQQCRCVEMSRSYCRGQIDVGKTQCMKLERYNSAQKVTCMNSINHYTRCQSSSQTHCWVPCQSIKHHEESGFVREDCSCDINAGFLTKPSLMVHLLVLLMGFLVKKLF